MLQENGATIVFLPIYWSFEASSFALWLLLKQKKKQKHANDQYQLICTRNNCRTPLGNWIWTRPNNHFLGWCAKYSHFGRGENKYSPKVKGAFWAASVKDRFCMMSGLVHHWKALFVPAYNNISYFHSGTEYFLQRALFACMFVCKIQHSPLIVFCPGCPLLRFAHP